MARRSVGAAHGALKLLSLAGTTAPRLSCTTHSRGLVVAAGKFSGTIKASAPLVVIASLILNHCHVMVVGCVGWVWVCGCVVCCVVCVVWCVVFLCVVVCFVCFVWCVWWWCVWCVVCCVVLCCGVCGVCGVCDLENGVSVQARFWKQLMKRQQELLQG